MNCHQNYIGGQWVNAATDEFEDLINPASEEVYGTLALSGRHDVDRAFQAAVYGAEKWRDATPSERQTALLRIADDLEQRAEEFADAESLDCGKPRAGLVEEEIMLSVDQFRFFAGAARHLEGKASAEYLAEHTSSIRREPVGVVAQIAPWNFPLNMATWKVAAALAGGNSTVLKPSETTPTTAVMLADIVGEHTPAGVFNLIVGARETGAEVIGHPIPQLVSLTGSTRAGRQIAAAAAPRLKRLHLELGGNAPIVVFPDADVDRVVATVAETGYFNAGQDCTAATRMLVHEDVYDHVLAALVEEVPRKARVGHPDEPDTFFGPVNNANQLAHVEQLVGSIAPHARIALGGKRWSDRGYYFEPTIIADVEQGDRVVQEEIFGPVVTVQRFSDEQQGIAYANGVEQGLSASVWTRDHSRALRLSRALDFGCVWINTHIPVVAEMPHGGFKQSGYGKDLSAYALEDYTRIKHVMSYYGD